MSYQFMHYELYSLESSTCKKSTKIKGGGEKLSKTKLNISQIGDEALRNENNPEVLEHLKKQSFDIQQPTEIYSIVEDGKKFELKNIAQYCQEVKEKNTDEIGRKMRKDASLLLAGVVSYKLDLIQGKTEKESMSECINSDRYKTWEKTQIEYLKKEYGDNFKCAVRHTDESHPHLHFYVVNTVGNGNARDLHSGFKALKDFRTENKERIEKARGNSEESKKIKMEENRVYVNAMKENQDRYFETNKKTGMLRIGPKRQRLTANEWRKRKEEAYNSYKQEIKIEEKKEELDHKENKILVEQKNIELQKQEIEAQKEQIEDKFDKIKKNNKISLGAYNEVVKQLGKLKDKSFELTPLQRTALIIGNKPKLNEDQQKIYDLLEKATETMKELKDNKSNLSQEQFDQIDTLKRENIQQKEIVELIQEEKSKLEKENKDLKSELEKTKKQVPQNSFQAEKIKNELKEKEKKEVEKANQNQAKKQQELFKQEEQNRLKLQKAREEEEYRLKKEKEKSKNGNGLKYQPPPPKEQ